MWGFLFIKWFNFHYRYTGKVSFIEDFQPALGAGDREFKSLYPDTRGIHEPLNKALSSDGAFCFHFLSFLFIIYQKEDTEVEDTTYEAYEILSAFLNPYSPQSF